MLSFDTTRTAKETTPAAILRCRRDVFTTLLLSNDRGIHRQTHGLSFDTTRIVQKTTRPTIILLLRVLFAVGTCLSSRFLATIHIQTHRPLR
jgi:hypothetical protein